MVGSADFKAMIARVLGNGTLDASFGAGGMVVSPPYQNSNVDEWAWARPLSDGSILTAGPNGALDSQGRLLVGVTGTNAVHCDSTYTVANYVAARFTTSGLLDTTFNSLGYSVVAFTTNPTHLDEETGITVDATDRAIMVGSPDASGFGLACLNTDGKLDNTFGP